jgi:hypothetical protein
MLLFEPVSNNSVLLFWEDLYGSITGHFSMMLLARQNLATGTVVPSHGRDAHGTVWVGNF